MRLPQNEPPSDAAEGPGKGLLQSAYHERLDAQSNPRSLAIFGRHNRTRCMATHPGGAPCRRCCRHQTKCSCPTEAPILEEVR